MLGIFLDIEANGLNHQVHRILEIALSIVDLNTGKVKADYESVILLSEIDWKKSDPKSLEINGFTWEEIQKGRSSQTVSKEIISLMKQFNIQRKKAVFICQNPSFDRVYFSQLIHPDEQEKLNWPYHWLDFASMFWALSIRLAKTKKEKLPWETGISKDAIAKRYQLSSEKQPHRAMNGVRHLLLCYEAVVGFLDD